MHQPRSVALFRGQEINVSEQEIISQLFGSIFVAVAALEKLAMSEGHCDRDELEAMREELLRSFTLFDSDSHPGHRNTVGPAVKVINAIFDQILRGFPEARAQVSK